LLVVIVGVGCGTGRPPSLSEVQTWRMFAANKSSIFESIRLFAAKEGFKLLRFDEEAGRILGHASVADTVEHRSRVIMMAMAVTQMDSVRCVVDARFNFANEKERNDAHSKRMLSAYYDLLFEHLSAQFNLSQTN
jgi:hypothetical protein